MGPCPEIEALLGKDSDAAVADYARKRGLSGKSKETIRRWREERKIPTFRRLIDWGFWDFLLGSVPDEDLAKRIGTEDTVVGKRRSRVKRCSWREFKENRIRNHRTPPNVWFSSPDLLDTWLKCALNAEHPPTANTTLSPNHEEEPSPSLSVEIATPRRTTAQHPALT